MFPRKIRVVFRFKTNIKDEIAYFSSKNKEGMGVSKKNTGGKLVLNK